MAENERKSDFTGNSGGKSPKKLRVLLRTFGCQMNVRDSEVICGLLKNAGYTMTAELENADVVIFNTCSVRQHAEDKVWSEIGRIGKLDSARIAVTLDSAQKTRRIKAGGHPTSPYKKIIGLVGCMAQNYQEAVFQRSPAVDFVVGPADIHKIPEILDKLCGITKREKRGQSPAGDSPLFSRKIWETAGHARPEEIYHTGFYEDKEHAYVVISEGCSNFCSYCVVPYVRGSLRSRKSEDILREIEEALGSGKTKITLLGQNVNAYHDSKVDFIGLLKLINAILSLCEFSFITCHPKDTTIELFKAMAELNKLKRYLHLPAQSGSDRILGLMNRGYSKKIYLDLADKYRKIVKAGALTADIIVGFPTESEKDFQETYDLVRQTGFNAAYIFKYSPRPHTQAALLPDDVEKSEKERRHRLILDLQKEISKNKR